MTIGIDASRANSRTRTGTEWYSYYVIEELKKIIPSHYRVVCYTREPLWGKLAELPPHWEERVLAWRPKFLWTQIRLAWEMLLRRCDILYVSAHTIPIIHPKKIVVVAHDVGFMRTDRLYDNKIIGPDHNTKKKIINLLVRLISLGKYQATERDYHRFSMALAIKHATKIITVSEFSKAEIKDVYKIKDERISVIYNGFGVPITPANPEQILAEFRVTRPYIIFIGRLELKKNIPRLIEAFALLRHQHAFNGKLVLVGAPGFNYSAIKEKIIQHGLHDAVIETGWCAPEKVGALLANASVFVFPSLYEGFGMPVLEAFAAGVPVACAKIPALMEVAVDAAHYFNPESVPDMARALNDILQQSKGELKKIIETAKMRAAQFSWQITARQTWDLMQAVIKNQ